MPGGASGSNSMLCKRGGNPRREEIVEFLLLILGRLLGLLVSKMCFLSFSTQSHAESFGNYLKKSVLDLTYAKLSVF